ncbi:MAG: glycosyltransferase [Desulfovermiculus sp.]|nr:glycosyltransferase [Desulfovermiculus sp.]
MKEVRAENTVHWRSFVSDQDMKILVSLTTTYERSALLRKSLPSLLDQEMLPDDLILNISETPYLKDSGFSEVPEWVKDLAVTINWVENTGSYRKLLPVLQEAGHGDLIVTADDDVIYSRAWLKDMIRAQQRHPGTIVCSRGRKMKKNIFGRWQNYRNWPLVTTETIGLSVLATGCGGIVYSRELLDLDFVFDPKYLQIAPRQDDLWFKMASMQKNVPTMVCPDIDKDNIYLEHKLGLDKENFNKIKIKFRLLKFIKRTIVQGKNYLGINQTGNDAAWDEICTYSRLYPQARE